MCQFYSAEQSSFGSDYELAQNMHNNSVKWESKRKRDVRVTENVKMWLGVEVWGFLPGAVRKKNTQQNNKKKIPVLTSGKRKALYLCSLVYIPGCVGVVWF